VIQNERSDLAWQDIAAARCGMYERGRPGDDGVTDRTRRSGRFAMTSSDSCGARALVIAVIAVAAWPAHAQSPSAQADLLFRQGKELMVEGKLAQACAAFDASQKLEPTPATQLNQANCRERNGQLATAWGLFLEVAQHTRAATDKASRQMHATATDRTTRLEPRLSTLRIDVAGDRRLPGLEVRRDGALVDPATWSQPLPLDGGSYRISARAPGQVEWSATVVVAAERDAQTIEIPQLQAARPQLDEPAPPPIARVVVAPGEPVTERPTWTGRRKLALATAGAGVAAIAIGGVLGATANHRQRDARAACPDPADCELAERATTLNRSGHNLALGADVALGVGAAAAITAGVLWLTGAPESRTGVAIAPAWSADQLAIVARGRF
jgi:hypothetical protein